MKAIGKLPEDLALADPLANADPTKKHERPTRPRSLATLSQDGRNVDFLDDAASAKAEQQRLPEPMAY